MNHRKPNSISSCFSTKKQQKISRSADLKNIEQVNGRQHKGKLFASWVIFRAFLSSADFFQNQLFRKILSGIPSECQIVFIQIRPDVLSGLIWVQTVCKSYQQTTLGEIFYNTKFIFITQPSIYGVIVYFCYVISH